MGDGNINASPGHRVTLTDRSGGSFLGVTDVVSFDTSEILLETKLGMIHIRGNDLHVGRLNLDKGEVDMEGRIDSLQYSEVKDAAKTAESLIGRLFR
jgi:sporulation protein YabP